MNSLEKALIELSLYGLGRLRKCQLPQSVQWPELFNIAQKHGLVAIVLDGINRCYENNIVVDIDFLTKMEWIGAVQQTEQRYLQHEKNMIALAKFYREHGIKMMVLKGYGLAQHYPKPYHRPSGDMDIYLFGEQERADKLLYEVLNIEIDKSHHHHTVFTFQGETVENHYDFLNVHVRKSNRRIEAKLKEIANTNLTNSTYKKGHANISDIILPTVGFNAIYLLRHCASHFASTEMTIRQVLDWGFFMEKHHKEIDWDTYLPYIKLEGMYRFYNLLGLFCMRHLGFDASIFHGLYSDDLFERFSNEILSSEFGDRENGKLLHSLSVKPRRWWHNRWKNRLCYPDSALSEFAYGLWAKVLKPSHFWQ